MSRPGHVPNVAPYSVVLSEPRPEALQLRNHGAIVSARHEELLLKVAVRTLANIAYVAG